MATITHLSCSSCGRPVPGSLGCHECGSISVRVGDWFQTFSGGMYWPFDPSVADIRVEDIAQALARICRFGGHCLWHLSVAQHCCLVADIVAERSDDQLLIFGALMHDAAEAYLSDMIRPIKILMPAYRELEELNMAVISRKFGLDRLTEDDHRIIKGADSIALMTEKRDATHKGVNKPWSTTGAPHPTFIVTEISYLTAVSLWLTKFWFLRNQLKAENRWVELAE